MGGAVTVTIVIDPIEFLLFSAGRGGNYERLIYDKSSSKSDQRWIRFTIGGFHNRMQIITINLFQKLCFVMRLLSYLIQVVLYSRFLTTSGG